MLPGRQAKDINADDVVLGLDAAAIRRSFVEKLFFEVAKFPGVATRNDHYLALARAVRDRILHRWIRSARTYLEEQHRTVIYLSAEYLMGPQLGNNLFNLGIEGPARQAMESLGLNLDELIEHEEEPGLGNGGLGRLAACFMDSLATLDFPAIGHGIRYEFGIFDQEIRDGWQVERTDRWLRLGNPWEVRRYEIEHTVGFGGRTETVVDATGGSRVKWIPARVVRGVPYDTPVVGYGTVTTNFLRLWAAVAAEEFDLDAFQVGEYWRAVDEKIRSENITKVLYPNDASTAGKQLRLEQEYFFVSCALQDCIRLLLQRTTIDKFADKFAIQLNDTHPTLAVPELMRLLMDEHGLGWDEAWAITSRSFNYTNHTLLPEALETWPLPLFQRLLPRHLEIVYEINRRFLDEVRARFPGDDARLSRLSLIDERGEKSVRMANLATVASQNVNGVAALHSRLLRETVLARLRRAVARALHERHERRHAAAVRRAREPAPVVAHHRGDRRRLAHGPRPPRRPGTLAADAGVPGALARREAGQQGAPGRVDPRHDGPRASTRARSSTRSASASTSTSGSTSTCCTSPGSTSASSAATWRASRRARSSSRARRRPRTTWRS